jgi:malate synthase
VVTKALFRQMLAEEQEVVRGEVGERWQSGRFAEASELMEQITCADTLIDFLTLPGYERL